MRKNVQRSYLQHKYDGSLYAIETNGDAILKAAGPLHPRDCTQKNLANWAFTDDKKLAADIGIRLYIFVRYEGEA